MYLLHLSGGNQEPSCSTILPDPTAVLAPYANLLARLQAIERRSQREKPNWGPYLAKLRNLLWLWFWLITSLGFSFAPPIHAGLVEALGNTGAWMLAMATALLLGVAITLSQVGSPNGFGSQRRLEFIGLMVGLAAGFALYGFGNQTSLKWFMVEMCLLLYIRWQALQLRFSLRQCARLNHPALGSQDEVIEVRILGFPVCYRPFRRGSCL